MANFKERFIYPEMIDGEVKELSMFDWLKFLPLHTFSSRHFESSEVEYSPLRSIKRKLDNGHTNEGEGKTIRIENDQEEFGPGDDE